MSLLEQLFSVSEVSTLDKSAGGNDSIICGYQQNNML